MDFRIILPIAVTAFGTFLLFKLRFFFLTSPFRIAKETVKGCREGRGFRGLCLSLAGTLGVGNIVGVALGICVGGAGSVFWLVLSSLFAMVLKYGEGTLAADCARCGHGGMGYVIESSFLRSGRLLSRTYAFLCLLLAFFMGCALQGATAVGFLADTFNFKSTTVVPVLIFLLLPVFLKGAGSVERFTAVIIPLTTIIYIFLCVSAIFVNFHRFPDALRSVLSGAFCTEGAAGGFLGFISSSALREGYARGLLSNEAGAGTSSYAHSVTTSHCCTAGLFGMSEVVFDTLVLCPLTAFAILVSPVSSESAVGLVMGSVGAVFGELSSVLLTASVFSFAYSTLICWYFYGAEALHFLLGRTPLWFLPLYLLFVILGGVCAVEAFVGVSDLILLFLTLISSSSLIKSSDRLKRLSEDFGIISRRCRGKRTLPPR